MKKFYLSKLDRQVFGVCGGLAAYTGIDSTILRVAMVFGACCWPPTILGYIIVAMIAPTGDGIGGDPMM